MSCEVRARLRQLGEQDPDSQVALPRLGGAVSRPAAGRSVGLKLVIQGHVLGGWWLHGNPGRRGHLDMLADDDGLVGPAAEGLAAARWTLDGLFGQPAPTGDDVRVCLFSL